ncbi:MAG: NAD-dependent epimerase/dehydratase family protein [Acidimicrobiales bacterium]
MRQRLLVLGGTKFVGRHIVESAIDAGHKVTLFHRGRTNPTLFPGCEHLHGDRDQAEYDAIRSGRWDAVIDTCAYVPRHVKQAMDALDTRAPHYVFISTVSVYADPAVGPIDEDAPLAVLDRPTEEVTGQTYGALKVACEQLLQDQFRGDLTIVRPGIVAGSHDPTDRFTYLVRRASAGGQMLCPPRGHQPVQVIHGRDLGDFVVRTATEKITGTFNAAGPSDPATMFDMIAACAEAADATIAPVWAPQELLAESEVSLPLALPEDGSVDGLFQASIERAVAAGLVNRSLLETAADTLAWDRERGLPPLLVGPDADYAADLAAAAASTSTS